MKITVTIDLAQVIPAISGLMVFCAALMNGSEKRHVRFNGWVVALTAQLLLIAFGIMTKTYTFGTYALVACAFAFNIIRCYRKRNNDPSTQ